MNPLNLIFFALFIVSCEAVEMNLPARQTRQSKVLKTRRGDGLMGLESLCEDLATHFGHIYPALISSVVQIDSKADPLATTTIKIVR